VGLQTKRRDFRLTDGCSDGGGGSPIERWKKNNPGGGGEGRDTTLKVHLWDKSQGKKEAIRRMKGGEKMRPISPLLIR